METLYEMIDVESPKIQVVYEHDEKLFFSGRILL
jgi:hypothetical protein